MQIWDYNMPRYRLASTSGVFSIFQTQPSMLKTERHAEACLTPAPTAQKWGYMQEEAKESHLKSHAP